MLRFSFIVEFICYHNINSVANTRLRFQVAKTWQMQLKVASKIPRITTGVLLLTKQNDTFY